MTKKVKNIQPQPQISESQLQERKAHFLLIDHSALLEATCREDINMLILLWSANFNGLLLAYDYSGSREEMKCKITMGGEELSEGIGKDKVEARSSAALKAIEFLQKHVHTVKMKRQESEVFRKDVILDTDLKNEALSEDNIGHKLLQMMGWSGGGLGKDGRGISEPITIKDVHKKKGLGSDNWHDKTNIKQFCQIISGMLKDYVNSDNWDDLVFAPGFSREERGEIHQLAQRMGLKTKSRGKDDDRYLSVSRRFSAQKLFEYLMTHGGSTNKYELIRPS